MSIYNSDSVIRVFESLRPSHQKGLFFKESSPFFFSEKSKHLAECLLTLIAPSLVVGIKPLSVEPYNQNVPQPSHS